MSDSCSDESINVWDLAKPGRIKVLSGHTATIHSLYVYGDVLYSGDADKTIFAWDILTLEPIHSFVAANDIICSIACSARRIFAATFATISVCSCSVWFSRLTHCRSGRVTSSKPWLKLVIWSTGSGPCASTMMRASSLRPATILWACGRRIRASPSKPSAHSLARSTPWPLLRSTLSLERTIEFDIALIFLLLTLQSIHVYNRTDYEHVQELRGHAGTGLPISH